MLLFGSSCMHTWKTDLVPLRFQSLEEPAILSLIQSQPPLLPHLPPRSEPLAQKDKIKSDVQICPPHFFHISLGLCHTNAASTCHTSFRGSISIRAGIFVMLSDDSGFHYKAILIELIQLDYISGAVRHVEQTTM